MDTRVPAAPWQTLPSGLCGARCHDVCDAHLGVLCCPGVRFSPYYRTKEKLSLSSATYSNTIQPKRCFCRFDLTGTCNDDDCSW